jgi:hypothetical protein
MMIEELVAADSHSKRPKKETSGRMGFAATGIPQDGLCQPEKDGKLLGFQILGFFGKSLAYLRQAVFEVGNLPLGVFRIRGRN